LLAASACFLLQTAAMAGPTTINFNFLNDPAAPSSGNAMALSSNVHTFYSVTPVDPNYNITATGYNYTGVTYPNGASQLGDYTNASPTTTDGLNAVILALKNQGPGETGLGLVPDPNGDYELAPPKSITLDITWLKSQVGITDFQIQLSSLQTAEGFYVFGSNIDHLNGDDKDGSSFQLGKGFGGASSVTTTVDIGQSDIAKYNYLLITPYGSGNSNDPNLCITALTITGDPTAVPEPASIVSAAASVGIGLTFWLRKRMRRSA
jgi:hypothetical protein